MFFILMKLEYKSTQSSNQKWREFSFQENTQPSRLLNSRVASSWRDSVPSQLVPPPPPWFSSFCPHHTLVSQVKRGRATSGITREWRTRVCWLVLFVCFLRFFLLVYSFVHEQSREVRGGDDSGSVRPTGSVSFREREREETPTVSLSSHFFLERRKFRRRKPKRFHVSPPSFRFNSFSFRFVSGFCFH